MTCAVSGGADSLALLALALSGGAQAAVAAPGTAPGAKLKIDVSKHVQILGKARVTGAVTPFVAGQKVVVSYFQGGNPLARHTVKVHKSGAKGSSQSDDNKGGSSSRGFASMDKDRQREIASEGGRAAHESGNAHEFTSEEARKAGQQSHGGQGGSSSGSSSGGSSSRGGKK